MRESKFFSRQGEFCARACARSSRSVGGGVRRWHLRCVADSGGVVTRANHADAHAVVRAQVLAIGERRHL